MKRSAALLGAMVVTVLPPRASGQTERLHEGWRWSEFYVESGLPANSTRDVIEALDGTVWAATEEGVAWFDGYAWHGPGSGSGLPDGRPLTLEVGREGGEVLIVVDRRLFVGSATDPFVEIPVVSESGDTLEVGDAAALGDGVLVASTRLGLFEVAPRTRLMDPGPRDPDFGLGDRLYRARSGAVLYNALDGLRLYRSEGRWEAIIPFDRQPLQIRRVLQLPGDAMWVYVAWPLDMKGMWQWSTDGIRTRLPDPSIAGVQAMDLDAAGRPIVLADDGGLYEVSESGWRPLPSLPIAQDEVHAIHRDTGGSWWIGAEAGLYLVRVDDRRWTHLRVDNGVLWNRVNDVLPLPNGEVWLATAAGLARAGPDGLVDTIPHILGRRVEDITGLARDGAGTIWLTSGSSPFIHTFSEEGGFSRYGEEAGLDGALIHRPFIDSLGGVWLLALPGRLADGRRVEGGLFRKRGDRFERWTPPGGMPGRRVYDMAEGPAGAVYFATDSGVVRTGSTPKVFGTDDGLAGTGVFALDVDRHGAVWFADRYYGVGRIDGEEARYFTAADGIPSDEVWDVLVHPRGDVWAATQRGLARFVGGEWIALGADLGAPNRPLWPLAVDGSRLFTGTLNSGVAVLNLAAAEANAPRLAVPEPSVIGRAAQLEWTAYAFRGEVPPSRMSTRYRVDEGPWSEWQTARSANVALDPGRHTLEVEARGAFGAPVTRGSASFSVERAVLLRPAALIPIVLMLVVIAGLSALLYGRRRRYQIRLAASEERYRRFFEEDLSGNCVFDLEGSIHDCNPAFARIFGFPHAQAARSTNVQDLATDLLWWPRVLSDLRALGRIEYGQARFARHDGSEVHCVYNIMAHANGNGAGGNGHARAYFFDDSQRTHLEEQLRHAQKMEAVGQLAGGVAHDFNNLLTAIAGYGELLLEDLPAGSAHRADVGGILDAARRAKELTAKLLAFGRRQVLEFQRVSLGELVEGMASLLSRVAGANLLLATEHEADVPLVAADASSLEQVILNLVVNASDAMHGAGSVTIRTGCRTVDAEEAEHIEGAHPGEYAVIEVEDNGPGIPPDVMDRMFEPFFTTKEVGRGTGLGLAMVYGIVRQTGGFVSVETAPGRGTRFAVHLLPAEPPQPTLGLDRDTTGSPATPGGTAGEVVLLVEDEEDVRHLLARGLRMNDFEVHTAESAAVALRAIEGGLEPDVIVTDVAMRGMSGTELVAELRRRQVDCDIIVVSGHAAPQVVRDASNERIRFLQKPFPPSALVRLLRQALDSRGRT